MNIAALNRSNLNNFDSKTGFVIGVTVEIPFTEKFSVQPELLYSAQGGEQRDTSMYDLNYVSLPIMAK